MSALINRITKFAGYLAVAMACGGVLAVAAAPVSLPTDSIYQLPVPLTDQDGRHTTLSAWRGQPVLISMFYTSCEFVCPRIVEAMKLTGKDLTARGNKSLPALLVTFDPDRDDIKTLKKVAEDRNLASPLWTLARTDARNARKLAALLGIQYKQLPSGDFNHTSVLILLDGEGRILGRTSTIGAVDPAFVKLAAKTLRIAGAG